jgi:hypothetical protein
MVEDATIIKIDNPRRIAKIEWNLLIRFKLVLIQELKEESHSLQLPK